MPDATRSSCWCSRTVTAPRRRAGFSGPAVRPHGRRCGGGRCGPGRGGRRLRLQPAGAESRRLRALHRGGDQPDWAPSRLSGRPQALLRALDLRAARLPDLLPHPCVGSDEVQHQVRRRALHGSHGWDLMRRRLLDLLRRVHVNGLHADHDHHDHPRTAVCVRAVPDLWRHLRVGRGLPCVTAERRLRVLPQRHPAVWRLALSHLQRQLPGGRAVRSALHTRRLRVRARRHHAVRRDGRFLRPRQLPGRPGVRPGEHTRAHLLHVRSCRRPLLRGRHQLRAGSGVQRCAGHLSLLPTLTRRATPRDRRPSALDARQRRR